MGITDVSIIHHIGIVLALLWILSYYRCCHPVVYFISLIYLYQVHERYIMRLHKKLQFEERKQANQRRLLSDSETVRWLNLAVEKVWPICMEQIMSQKILLPIVPWFLEKFKPWAAKKAVVQHLYLGRNPPIFTDIRVHRQSSDDDHLVLELGMNFLTADDMSAILSVKLRKRLGFGIWAKLHVTGMHVEGKVLVGVKFLREWPFLGRLRVCFAEPPYFQMTVKPIVSHGLDVTELPGIAGWLDKLLAVAFEQTLVEPNMLVVDMEKFASGHTDNWFSVDEKDPIAYAQVEIVEAADMKPSDSNGLADPYVKGQLGPYRFQTKTQKKTLAPKWQEEFKIPICTWESPNELALEVRDKDHFVDDALGDCSLNISDLRGGQRHDMWLPLQNIKMGRLHLAVTVLDVNAKEGQQIHDEKSLNKNASTKCIASELAEKGPESTISSEKAQKMADDIEPINIEGQKQTGIWVHRPGSDVSQTWEPRKRKSRRADIQIHREDNDSMDSPSSTASGSNHNVDSSSDENVEGKGLNPLNKVRRKLRNIRSVFHWSPRKEDDSITREAEAIPSPHVNLWAVNERGTTVKLIVDDDISATSIGSKSDKEGLSPERNVAVSPKKGKMKDMAKSILKHAERSANGLKHVLSRKGSDRFKGDSGSASAEIENHQGSDSSDEGSLSTSIQFTSTVEGITTESSQVFAHGAESPDHKEQNTQVGACASAENIEEAAVGELPFQGEQRGTTSLSDVHGEGLAEECLTSKISEGNFEAEKT